MRKKFVKIISSIFPGFVASYAYNQLTNPQIRKLRDHELVTLDKAIKAKVNFKGFDIKTYKWEGGDRKILLIHGWEGQAGNFSNIIDELLKNGFTVYSFDAPSHGFSSRGKTSLFEFTELVGVLIRKFSVKDLISHSFGGVATTFALFNNTDLVIDKYALLTTPDKFTERIDEISEMVGISKKVKNILIKRLKNESSMDIYSLNVSDFVKKINVKQSLIIHDKNDRVIPIEKSKNVHKNWNASQFLEIEGTGHFRILRTPIVINEVIKFLKE